mmetsp:Transcript_10152/g.42673  ORF Transcript_10152/g.42673 Transcript_10152/m.42673 type:complete len:217 (+) Transcript_10152:1450-2100(+)
MQTSASISDARAAAYVVRRASLIAALEPTTYATKGPGLVEARAARATRANASSKEASFSGSYENTDVPRRERSSPSPKLPVRSHRGSIVPRRIASYCASISAAVSAAARASSIGATTQTETCFPLPPTGPNGAAVQNPGFTSRSSGATRSPSPWYPSTTDVSYASSTIRETTNGSQSPYERTVSSSKKNEDASEASAYARRASAARKRVALSAVFA